MPEKQPHRHAPKSSLTRNIVGFLLAFILIAVIFSLIQSPLNKPEEVGINRIVELIQTEQIEEIRMVDGANMTITLNNEEETVLEARKELADSLETTLVAYGVTPEELQTTNIVRQAPNAWTIFLVNVLPILGPAVLIIFFLWMMLRQVQGSNNRAMMFGQSRAQAVDPDQQKKRTTFDDVAGATEAKEELREVVDFLRNPNKYVAIGARIPRGVLLMGSPGTGKTLLARAVAGEANVPFFHISGSEFVEMFVGVGASRVRDVFKKAKKSAPAILFIDEIDAVGRQRGTGMGGSHDEREQTLNQILTEMDGFEEESGVIVIAATNRPDVLDPALLRPGRFDRRVILDLPDIADREAILTVHAKNKLMEEEVDLKTIAQRTTGFSGADLMNLLNEAAIAAAREDRKKVSLTDCLESIDKVLLGPQRKSAKSTEKEKEITAYHEAGHALIAHLLPDSDPVHKISIIPRGRAGGFTLKLPEEDKKLHSRKEMMADIAVSLGGHAAEMFKFDDLTTGPSNDLEKATGMARRIVTSYGMSTKMGPRTFGKQSDMIFLGKEIHEQRDYSEETAREIDKEMDHIIEEQYTLVNKLIREHEDKLDAIAAKLLEVETIERPEFEALFGITPETTATKKEADTAEKTEEAPAA